MSCTCRSGCSKCNNRRARGITGATGPAGATGATGAGSASSVGTGLFAVSHVDQTLLGGAPTGDPLLAEDFIVFNGAVAFNPLTGVATFNVAGLYLVHYGFRNRANGIISGAILPQRNGTIINAATITFLALPTATNYEKSFLQQFAIGDTLQIVNDGSGQVIEASPNVGGHVGTSFFFTLSRIGS